MRTSRKTDFRKLKITLVTLTYHSQRPQCPSLSPHILLTACNTPKTGDSERHRHEFLLPPRAFLFCREVFFFYSEVFFFAVSFSFFAASFSFLSWNLWVTVSKYLQTAGYVSIKFVIMLVLAFIRFLCFVCKWAVSMSKKLRARFFTKNWKQSVNTVKISWSSWSRSK